MKIDHIINNRDAYIEVSALVLGDGHKPRLDTIEYSKSTNALRERFIAPVIVSSIESG